MIKLPLTLQAALLAATLLCSPSAQAQDWGAAGAWGDYEWGGDMATDFDAFDNDHTDPSDFASDTDPEFEQDEVLALNLSGDGEDAARRLGFTVLETLPLPSLHFSVTRLRLPGGFRARKALEALRLADPEGEYGANAIYRLASETSPGAGSACEGLRCYGRQLVHWPQGCAVAARIGMLDSAVDVRHPALDGRKLYRNRVSQRPVSRREQEHGTAVAALLVGAPGSDFPGLLPGAKLFAADVFQLDTQAHPYTDALLLAQGLDWLAHQQLDVLNISIAGPDSPVLRAAVQNLAGRGVVMAAAAGNLGAKAPPLYPAAYPEVLAVTAVDRRLQVYAKANRGRHIRLSAPGVGIWTAGDEGAGVFRDGTSFAAPFVTAALAMSRIRGGGAQNTVDVMDTLAGRARDIGAPGADPVYGAGLLQAPACGAILQASGKK